MKTKQWGVLFVLALFVASIAPFVVAENDDAAAAHVQAAIEANTNASFRNQGDAKKVDQEGFAQAREDFKQHAEAQRKALLSKRQEIRNQTKGERKNLRDLYAQAEASFKADRQKLKELHDQFKDKRDALKQERENERKQMNDVRDDVRKCAGDTSDTCNDTRNKARGHATAYLNRAVEHVISVLENARDRIEGNEKLSADAKASALAGIDSAIVEAGAAKSAAAALGDNATKEDIQAVSQMIHSAAGKAREAIKAGVSAAAGARIGGIIVQMQHLQDKFDRVIAQLKKQGKDTSSAEAKKAEFQAKLAAAADAQNSAQTLFASKDMQGATAKLKEAHDDLQAAQNLLKGIVQEIRGIGGNKELDHESEASAQESEHENDTGKDAHEGETA